MDYPRSPAPPPMQQEVFSPKPQWDVAPQTPEAPDFQPQPHLNVPPQSPPKPKSPLPSGTPRQIPQTWQSNQEINAQASGSADEPAADLPAEPEYNPVDDLFDSQGDYSPDSPAGFLPKGATEADYFELFANDNEFSPVQMEDSPIGRMPDLSSTEPAPAQEGQGTMSQTFSPGWSQPPPAKSSKAMISLAHHALAQVARRDRNRYAFLSTRVGPVATRLSKKGREIKLSSLPTGMRKKWDDSDLKEWREWLENDAVYWPGKAELEQVDNDEVVPMRIVRSDNLLSPSRALCRRASRTNRL